MQARGQHRRDAAGLPALYAEIGQMPEGLARDALLSLLMARWADVDVEGGLAFLKIAGDFSGGWATLSLLTEWATRDPAAAFLAAGTDPQLLSAIGEQLLERDGEQFWAWFRLARLPSPPLFNGGAAWLPVIESRRASPSWYPGRSKMKLT